MSLVKAAGISLILAVVLIFLKNKAFCVNHIIYLGVSQDLIDLTNSCIGMDVMVVLKYILPHVPYVFTHMGLALVLCHPVPLMNIGRPE